MFLLFFLLVLVTMIAMIYFTNKVMHSGYKMKCIRCGSENIQVQMVADGSTTKNKNGKLKTKNKIKKVCVCQDCGNSWNVLI